MAVRAQQDKIVYTVGLGAGGVQRYNVVDLDVTVTAAGIGALEIEPADLKGDRSAGPPRLGDLPAPEFESRSYTRTI